MAIVTRYACDVCGCEVDEIPSSWTRCAVNLPTWRHPDREDEQSAPDEEDIAVLVCDCESCQGVTVAELAGGGFRDSVPP